MSQSPDEDHIVLSIRSKITEGDVAILDLVADGGLLPPAAAGSHLILNLPNGLKRSYSLLRGSEGPDAYRIAVLRQPGGRGGSTFVHDSLAAGDTILSSPPRSGFPLVEDADASIFVAGGIGVTPLLAMARRLAEIDRPFQFHLAVRSREQAIFANEIEALGPLFLHVDDERMGQPLDMRTVLEAAPETSHIYCCGPEGMLDAFLHETRARAPETVHFERFAAARSVQEERGFTVVLKRSGQELFVPPSTSILERLVEAGVEVQSSCCDGVCGTCETVVLEGTVDHRDGVLTNHERESGSVMMICVSRAQGDTLVLDL
jgi:ferredoxin-NADP reductase